MADVPLVNNPMTAVADSIIGGTVTGGVAAPTRLKNNWSAAVAPAVTDDSGDGYAIGSRWIDTTADKEYVATDVTVGAAVWKETTGAAGGSVATDAIWTTAGKIAVATGTATATEQFAAARHGCLVYHNTTQTVNGTFVLFNTEIWDSDAYHSTVTNTERITIPAGLGGLYLLEFGTLANSVAVGEFCRISINGGANISTNEGDTNSGYISGLCVYPLVATDYVTVVFTGNRVLGHASAYEAQSHFSATLLAT